MRTESGQQRSRRGLSRSKVSSLNAQHSVLVFALCALLLALCSYAEAQSKIPHVGILFKGGRDQPHLEEFKQGLRERGIAKARISSWNIDTPRGNTIDCRTSLK